MDLCCEPQALWAALQEWLWPGRCVSCSAASPTPLCPPCARRCTRHTGARCGRCDDLAVGPLCERCRGRPGPHLERARGVWRYGGPVQRAVLAGKHHGHEALWQHLAAAVAQDREARALGLGADALVPIPLSGRRRWQRGYNPSALLARALGQAWGKPVHHLLRRRPSGRPPQSRLDGATRQQGLEGLFAPAFGAPPLTARTLLLVDDVITTGATLQAAAAALYARGARAVWAVSVARQVRATLEHGVRAPSSL